MRKISPFCLDKIKAWEGKSLVSYKDDAGVWSIGFGHTTNAGMPVVTPGMKISELEAETILRRDLSKFEERVNRLVTVPITDNQFGCLVSFDFNTGALDKSSLLKKLNKEDYECVPSELMKWNKITVNGRKVTSPGLVNRRAAEAGLWATGAFVASAHTSVAPETKPLKTSRTVAGGSIAATTVAAGGVINETKDQISDLVYYSDFIRWAFLALSLAGIGLMLYARWDDHNKTKA